MIDPFQSLGQPMTTLLIRTESVLLSGGELDRRVNQPWVIRRARAGGIPEEAAV